MARAWAGRWWKVVPGCLGCPLTPVSRTLFLLLVQMPEAGSLGHLVTATSVTLCLCPSVRTP
jgi:hypothetical protein